MIDDSVATTGGASAFQTQSRNCLVVRRRRPSVLTNIAVATDVRRDYTAMCISAASLAFSTCRLCFVFSVCLHAVFSLIVAWLHVVFVDCCVLRRRFLIDGCVVTCRFLLIVALLHVVFVDCCALRHCFFY